MGDCEQHQRTNNLRSARIQWTAAAGIALMCLAVRLPWLTSAGFNIDLGQFVQWSEVSRAPSDWSPPGGLASVYSLKTEAGDRYLCNYPPAYIFVLRGLATLYDRLAPDGERLDRGVVLAIFRGEETAATRLAYILYKLPAVLADMVLGLVLFRLLSLRFQWRVSAALAALYLLMPAVIHNSALWGQVDAIPTLLMVLSLELARRRRLYLMAAVATLAMLTKAQAAMMAPLWAVVAVDGCLTGVGDARGRASPKQIIARGAAMLGVSLAVTGVMLFPFRHALDGVWQAYVGAPRLYPFTHLNGFSAWFLGSPLSEPKLGTGPLVKWYAYDGRPLVFGISARQWGLIGVLCVWGLVMARLWRRRCDDGSLRWAARLLPLAFFVLSTQMHERYLFPAMAIWVWAYVPSKRWWSCWWVMCLCITLNVLWVWPGPEGHAWADGCRGVLHRPWFGIVPGVWCSLALVGIMTAAVLEKRELRIAKSE